MKKFQELLTKDLGWKLLSIAIAATMWFMVINITQPVDTRSYSRPLTLENMDTLTSRGLTVGNAEELKNTKITVKVKAQRTALDRLSQNPDWITASVDLSELAYAVNGDSVALPVNVSIDQGGTAYAISSKAPAVVEAQVENLRTKEFPIEVELNGKPDSDIPFRPCTEHGNRNRFRSCFSGAAGCEGKGCHQCGGFGGKYGNSRKACLLRLPRHRGDGCFAEHPRGNGFLCGA